MPGIDYRAARAQLPLAAVLDLLGFVPHRLYGQQLRGASLRASEASSRSLLADMLLDTA